MDEFDWWGAYGVENPDVAEKAKSLLSQSVSSSSAERNSGTYSYIHNVKRNHLNAKRADTHVFVHSNIIILSRFSESYKSGPKKKVGYESESEYIEGLSARLEKMVWKDLKDKHVDNGKWKKQKVD